MKMIRDHGQAKKYYHDVEGYNGRLDSIQAGWLSVKLRHLSKWNESRRALAHAYHKLFADLEGSIVLPIEAPLQRAFTTCMSSVCRTVRRCKHIWQKQVSERGSTIPFLCSCKRPISTWDTNKVLSRLARRWRVKFFICPCFRSSRESSRCSYPIALQTT